MALISLAVASIWQLLDVPSPPLKLELAGSQAISPAAAINGSPEAGADVEVAVGGREVAVGVEVRGKAVGVAVLVGGREAEVGVGVPVGGACGGEGVEVDTTNEERKLTNRVGGVELRVEA